MSWFSLLKIAYPYSRNLCPACTTPLDLDFREERGNEGKEGVGRCPACGRPFVARRLDAEESPGFPWSVVDPLGEQDYRRRERAVAEPMVAVVAEDD